MSIEILKRNKDRTEFDVISPQEVSVGDVFEIGVNPQTKETVYFTVTQILEQRKGKGTYADESLRPFWAKVS